ncbi:HWE histidine kinase domain-containing protein [Sphingobium olei]|uniref:HWE histidine kinase domain-containing protein n=1 Tax=Sphingobium olei TaxID=420955 RepID=UPI003D2368F6
MVSQSLKSTVSIEEAGAAIDTRLATLNRTVEQLLDADWGAAPLDALVQNALVNFSPYAGRWQCSGPPVDLGPSSAMTLMLALNELATNAVKFGAFSNETGTVELTWQIVEVGGATQLWLLWTERGGPPVRKPERQGFGSRLISTAAGRSLRGRAEIDFPQSGVTWTLVAPLAALRG